MSDLLPVNQTKLFGLDKFLIDLIKIYESKKLPNKILLSGQKGLGKSTMAYHFINYVLSQNEESKYDLNNFEINKNNHSYKTVLNKSNLNVSIIDILPEKKNIDINQIRELINNLNKSSFNQKPRFVLIDNIEFLNINSVNALLKIIEEPSLNTIFILINNNKKILPTLLSRCINFKIFLSNKEILEITNKLLENKLHEIINIDLINYYLTPGNIYDLVQFGRKYKYDLLNFDLRELLKIIINKKHYKNDDNINYLIFDLIQFYFLKTRKSISIKFETQYDYFLRKLHNTKKYNLDYESLFMEFEDKILNE